MARPPPRKQEPVVLKPLELAGYCLLMPLAIAGFVVGILGITVLMDTEGKNSLSHSQFGQLYKSLIAKNPFFSAMLVNGGLIITLLCITSIARHFQAKKKAKALPAPPVPAGAPAGEAKVPQEVEAKKDK